MRRLLEWELLGDHKPSFFVLHCTGTGEIIKKHQVNINVYKILSLWPLSLTTGFQFYIKGIPSNFQYRLTMPWIVSQRQNSRSDLSNSESPVWACAVLGTWLWRAVAVWWDSPGCSLQRKTCLSSSLKIILHHIVSPASFGPVVLVPVLTDIS